MRDPWLPRCASANFISRLSRGGRRRAAVTPRLLSPWSRIRSRPTTRRCVPESRSTGNRSSNLHAAQRARARRPAPISSWYRYLLGSLAAAHRPSTLGARRFGDRDATPGLTPTRPVTRAAPVLCAVGCVQARHEAHPVPDHRHRPARHLARPGRAVGQDLVQAIGVGEDGLGPLPDGR